jgi:serine phosphatase RsbU (regulator of sigma subunit)
MYTDGITETTRENREQFSEARLLEMLRKNRNLEAEQILRKIEDAVDQFRLGEQEDDLTLVIACAR